MPRQIFTPLLRAVMFLLGCVLLSGCAPRLGLDNLASSNTVAVDNGNYGPLYGPAYKNSPASARAPSSRPRNLASSATERRRRNAKHRRPNGFRRRASYASGRMHWPRVSPKKQLRGPKYKNRTAKSH